MPLVPITRSAFEELIPVYATGAQYVYCWGKFRDFIQQLLISIVAVTVMAFVGGFLGPGLQLTLGIIAALYWLWLPVAKASTKNFKYRRYKYSGFWQGRILDVYVTEELIGTEETANTRGELVIVENRERRLNLEVGDKTGFVTTMQVPLTRNHQVVQRGLVAQMLVMSNESDLSYIAECSDVYLPSRNLWISDYPCVRRDIFLEIAQQLKASQRPSPEPRSRTAPDGNR
jgi:hypothetical protein